MKQLGNLAIVCAQRTDVLLQILNGKATVFVGRGPGRTSTTMSWDDDNKISETVQKLNFGEYSEKKGKLI
jgi:hypothetical protein